jgi:hypothetical protein
MFDLTAHLTAQCRHRLVEEYWHTNDQDRAKELWSLLYPDGATIQEASAP